MNWWFLGGIGRAARDWKLRPHRPRLCSGWTTSKTLLVQSGKLSSASSAPTQRAAVPDRIPTPVPHWATRRRIPGALDRKGLMMYGQMTAGSWIYIGSQGIVQGTYETFVELGRRHYNGDLSGKWILPAASAAQRRARPLAAVMAGASCLAVECQQLSRIEMRLRAAISTSRPMTWMSANHHPRGPAATSGVGGSARQCRRDLSGIGAAWRTARCRHRSGLLGARSGEWLSAEGLDHRRMGRPPRDRSEGRRHCCPRLDGRARSRHARFPSHGHSRSRQATTFARWRWRKASRTRSTFRASFSPTSNRCSAVASARSLGRAVRRSRDIIAPTPR